jgi:DNA-binding beta-propeller fold protein YncE
MNMKGTVPVSIINRVSRLLTIMTLFLMGCQSVTVATQFAPQCSGAKPTPSLEVTAGRIPEVMGKIGIQMSSSSEGIVTINPCTGYVYVAGSKHVTILKGSEVIGELETQGSKIVSMAVDEVNDLVYVVDEYDDIVTVLHGKQIAGVVPTIGHEPRKVVVEPRSRDAYVVSGYKNRPLTGDSVGSSVLVISGTQVIKNLQISGRLLLTQVVADPIYEYIYASGVGGDIVIFKGLQEVVRHDLKESIDSMDVNPRTGEVYALTHQTLHRFKEGKLIDSVELSSNMGNVWQIRVHPTTGVVYIPHTGYVRGEARITVVENMKVIDDIQVGGLAALGIDSLTGNVYAAIFGDGMDQHTVAVIQGTQVVTKIKSGWYPYNVGVNPNNGWVYVSNINEGTVTILGYSSGKPIAPSQPTIAVYP